MPQPAAPSRELDERIRTAALVVLAVIATGAALHWLRAALVPFALALFLSIALSPVVDALAARWRLSRTVAVVAAMALGALLVLALGTVVASSVADLVAAKDTYQANLVSLGERLFDGSPRLLGVDLERVRAEASPRISAALEDGVGLVLGALGALLSQGLSVLIFLMFLLVEQRRPEGGLAGLLDARVKGYVAVKVLTSSVTGLLVGATLALLGVDAALLFGLLTFLLNFIPTLGSIVAVLLPLPIVLAGDHSVTVMILALALPMAIQFVIGQLWESKKLGDAFDLRASVVLLALVVWGKLFGVVGMFLATPITAVLKSILADWPLTAPVARAMGAPRAGAAPKVARG